MSTYHQVMQDLQVSSAQTEKSAEPPVQVVASPEVGRHRDKPDEVEMPPVVSIMEPILRFLQLLCENHNRELQVETCFCLYLIISFFFWITWILVFSGV